MKRCCLFGHSFIASEKKDVLQIRLGKKLEELVNRGIVEFYFGNYGDFDKLVLIECCKMKEKHSEVGLYLCVNSIKYIKRDEIGVSYSDLIRDKVKTLYFEVENEHYKNRITKKNQLIVDCCDIVVCYVDFSVNKSGSKNAVKYAIKKEKHIHNLLKP